MGKEVPELVTAVVIDEMGQHHIRLYDTNDLREAGNSFVKDWIEGKVFWENDDYYGHGCSASVPAFDPLFLMKNGMNEKDERFAKGVLIHTWWGDPSKDS
jgi:hypothetical protein